MATVNQHYAHQVFLVAGAQDMYALQIGVTAPTGAVTVVPGMVGHLDANQQFALGVSGTQVPLWAINGNRSVDLDVYREDGVIGGNKINCFVGMPGVELFTSEFVAGTYTPATTLLIAATASSALGKATAASTGYQSELLIGVTSRGLLPDQNGSGNFLYFWTTWRPAVQ
jgi:hypothetical protein